MTIYCILCKQKPIAYDNTRSFHRFPANHDVKKAWMEAIGVSSISKKSTICSDHFDIKSYHQTDGYTHLKRLLSNAVPSINLYHRSSKSLQNSNQTNNNMSIVKDENDSKNLDFQCQDQRNKINDFKQHAQKADNKFSTSLLQPKVLDNLKNPSEIVLSTENSNNCSPSTSSLEIVHELSENLSSKKNIFDSTMNIKRKQSSNTAECTKPKKIRFKDGVQSFVITRDFFVSDDKWNIFLKYCAVKNRQSNTQKRRSSRQDNKIRNLSELMAMLKEKKAYSAVNY